MAIFRRKMALNSLPVRHQLLVMLHFSCASKEIIKLHPHGEGCLPEISLNDF